MTQEYTLGEFEEMDLRELHDQVFMVAVNSGPREENSFMCSTLCGPMGFYEMCETVGFIFEKQMIHSKVMICEKEFGKPPKVLDESTIDFIEARYQDIVIDGALGGELLNSKEYTCTAGFNSNQPESKDDIEQDSSTG